MKKITNLSVISGGSVLNDISNNPVLLCAVTGLGVAAAITGLYAIEEVLPVRFVIGIPFVSIGSFDLSIQIPLTLPITMFRPHTVK